jgi:23S rRNA U2552 (ribose-2'-O)-methylase RlmE/FtsJ
MKGIIARLEQCDANGENSLIHTSINIINTSILPIDTFRYISRVFYVPYSCNDLDWIFHHTSFVQCISNSNNVFKVQTSPKSMEKYLIDMLFTNEKYSIVIHPSNYTHSLNCVYNKLQSTFRWGICTRQFISDNQLTSECLQKRITLHLNSYDIPPICRAYFKMQEIIEVYFPQWGWKVPDMETSIGIDIGASPGGWSQYLSKMCHIVYAVDPGDLNPIIHKEITNIVHLKDCGESAHVNNQISNYLTQNNNMKVRFCVCDVNIEGPEAANILCENILPLMKLNTNNNNNNNNNTAIDDANVCSDGILVLTLKLPKNPSSRYISKISNIVQNILTDSNREIFVCYDIHIIHLNANTRNERTLVCRVRIV